MSATSRFSALLGAGFPVVSAPMAGVSDKAFRVIACDYGARLAWTEMIAAAALARNPTLTEELLDLKGEDRTVVQLFGAEPEEMAVAAALAAGAGAAAIDINMGCPVDKVVGSGAGAALMLRPERAAALVAAVKKAVALPVTVKMRRGWDERSPDAVVVAEAVVAAGADAVIVHGRYRSQFFSGRADWGIIAAVKRAVAVPVIGNGDVRSAEDAAQLFATTGCDAVMIGRAARGNPWLFTACQRFLQEKRPLPPPGPEERVATALKHCSLLECFEGARALVKMKRQADWYMRGLPGAARLRESLYRAESAAEIKLLLMEFLTCS
ncbi:tRNA dihydrouridine synthase DusB [Thermodesulfitimonas autotrophica]|uniref:tRNA dihydrouridine synthase DusB n=1 Tax=Thermodesulfitimonas autotrophica TaxID=1894989 RepID=UPI002FE19A61